MLTLFYFILFILALLLVAITPWLFLYQFSDAMAYLLRHVIKYRIKTTRKNLLRSFPDKSSDEIVLLENGIYQNLADISVETLKGFTMSNRNVLKRHKFKNPEFLETYYRQGVSLIGVTAHYNNWEWGAMSAGLQLKHTPIAIYKPLSNKLIDWFIKWHRSLRGTKMVPTIKTYETFEKYKDKPCIYLLVADQKPSPNNIGKAHWINFLNQDTPCIHGPEKYAKLYNYPVVYIDIQRIARGRYEIEFSLLCSDPNLLPVGKITELYMEKLEQVIRKEPCSWLWTHRRWKRKRPVEQKTA